MLALSTTIVAIHNGLLAPFHWFFFFGISVIVLHQSTLASTASYSSRASINGVRFLKWCNMAGNFKSSTNTTKNSFFYVCYNKLSDNNILLFKGFTWHFSQVKVDSLQYCGEIYSNGLCWIDAKWTVCVCRKEAPGSGKVSPLPCGKDKTAGQI